MKLRKLHTQVVVINSANPAGNYLLKFNNTNTRTVYEIRSKLTIKTAERRHWRLAGVLLLTLNIFHTLF